MNKLILNNLSVPNVLCLVNVKQDFIEQIKKQVTNFLINQNDINNFYYYQRHYTPVDAETGVKRFLNDTYW